MKVKPLALTAINSASNFVVPSVSIRSPALEIIISMAFPNTSEALSAV